MPRSKKCKNRSFPERRNSRSFLSKLLSVFRCSGKNSVRVQPTHISVRPATATMDVRAGSQTPLVFFSSSRPSTAIRPTTSTKGCSHPSTCQQPIQQVSTPLASSSLQIDHISVSDMNAASETPISADRSVEVSASHLQGLSPSPATSATTASDASHVSSGGSLDVPRAPTYFRTNLSQMHTMQRQKEIEERRKREEILLGKKPRKVTFNPILEEELKPKKRLSQQIRDEEAAIKKMHQALADMAQDETEVLEGLKDWRVKIQRKDEYTAKEAQLYDVLLTLESHMSMLKSCGRKIKTELGYKTEKLAELKVDYELLLALGYTKEELETEELLQQFLPTLGISPESFSITNLDDFLNEDEDMAPRPGSMNPIAAQLLKETSSSMSQLHMHVQKPNTGCLPDILDEYHHTLKRKSTSSKKTEVGQRETKVNDGLKKFMLSQLQNKSKM